MGPDPMKPHELGTCMWFQQGCSIGCPKCTGASCNTENCCNVTMKPTLPESLRTYMDIPVLGDVFKHNPWRAPGFAPVESPCGLAGGGYGKPDIPNGGIPPSGLKRGFDGRNLSKAQSPLEWHAGSVQEVSWNFVANHGGGYAYRLCPADSELTEECFQDHHLEFVGDQSWLEYGKRSDNNRTAINASRISTGTNPKGSQWTRNPIPACSGAFGGSEHSPGCDKPQFEPPIPGLYGFGLGRCNIIGKHWNPLDGICGSEEFHHVLSKFKFNIVDKVKVPQSLKPGDYVLSWRWDCDQTAQVWASCADIKITAPAGDIVV